MSTAFPWRLPAPFTLSVRVEPAHLDDFGHVNNAVYIQWLEQCAWAHSAAVGLPVERCVALERGMAIRRTEVDYLGAAFADETLVIGNWVTAVNRLRATRHFEIFRERDGVRLLVAKIDFVCINLKTGTPTRFPDDFVAGYRVDASVAEARAELPSS